MAEEIINYFFMENKYVSHAQQLTHYQKFNDLWFCKMTKTLYTSWYEHDKELLIYY